MLFYWTSIKEDFTKLILDFPKQANFLPIVGLLHIRLFIPEVCFSTMSPGKHALICLSQMKYHIGGKILFSCPYNRLV